MNQHHNKGKLFIISAPSGTGKSTLVSALLNRIGASCRLERVITYTSKDPRPGEIPGVDYHFISKEDFEKRLAEGFFIEHSLAYGTYYGSPVASLHQLEKGTSSLLIVDRIGAQTIKAAHKEAVMIWIYPPSLEILRHRLEGRNTESREAIKRRLARAVQELEMEKQNPLYNFYVLNDDFMCALEKLEEIVFQELKIKIDVQENSKNLQSSDL